MRMISRHFKHLTRGYQRIEDLNRRLKAEWTPKIEAVQQGVEIQNARLQADYQVRQDQCRVELEERRNKFNEIHNRWADDDHNNRVTFQAAVALWDDRARQINDIDKQIRAKNASTQGLTTWIAISFGLTCLIIFSCLSLPAMIILFVVWEQDKKHLNEMINQRNQLAAALGSRPVYKPEPEPKFFAGTPARGEPQQIPVPDLDLLQAWWDAVGRDPDNVVNSRRLTDGDEGERSLISELGRYLADDYACIAGALVKTSLDADVLVLAKGRIWVLDSKYLRGSVHYRNGNWRQSKSFFLPGKELGFAEKDLGSLHDEWERERGSIQKTLEFLHRETVLPEIRGGLVFHAL